jgi:hypothetical protein
MGRSHSKYRKGLFLWEVAWVFFIVFVFKTKHALEPIKNPNDCERKGSNHCSGDLILLWGLCTMWSQLKKSWIAWSYLRPGKTARFPTHERGGISAGERGAEKGSHREPGSLAFCGKEVLVTNLTVFTPESLQWKASYIPALDSHSCQDKTERRQNCVVAAGLF